MAALICDVKQYAENLVRWSRLSGLLLLFVFAGVCGAEEMPFKMSSLVLPQGVSYTLGPVTLTRALEQATSANKTGKTSSLQSHEALSTKKTVGSGVESSTTSGRTSGYNLGGSIGGSAGGAGSVSLMGLLGINLGGKVSGEDTFRQKTTNHNGTESTLENSRQSANGSSSEFEEQEQYGSYHLRFTVSFKSKDLSDTFLVGGPNASVILNGFSAPVKVQYTERNEAVRLGAEERILFFDYPIADQVTLRDAKRFAATGRRNAVTLSLTGDDFPVVSERTKRNMVSEITRIMQTIPNTVVSLDFGDVKRLSPWRIRRKFARSSRRGGQHVTIREALEALNEVIAKDEEMPEVAFRFAKDGRLEAVGDTPTLAPPRKDDLTFIAVSVVTDTHEADTEVHFPTKTFLSRPLSDFTDVRFVQLQLSELVHASVTAPETVKTLREEIESVLPSVNGTEKLWRILREGQKEKTKKEEEEVKSEPEKKVRESASHERATSHEGEKAPKGKGLKTGDIKMIMLPGGVTMEMIYCGPGSFIMGSPTSEEGRYDDEMQHKVTFSKGFWLGKYEVTQAQWESVMKFNPSSAGLGEDKPVESVSWEDCQKFIQGVNDFKNYNARLPTEAEWEYACRAGSTGSYGGNGKLDDMGWYAGDYCSGGRTGNSGGTTHSVGRKRGNAWGFHDMHGNVAEWCHEWYGDYYQGDQTDPQGRSSPDGVFFYHGRVRRGGDWRFGKQKECRSAYRTDCAQGNRLDYIGFRLCCSAAACE